MSVGSLAKERIASLFDDGVFTELDRFGNDAVVTGYGLVNGSPCYAYSQNIDADGGAMCLAQAEKIEKVYSLAEKTGYPIVGIFDSNGGKLSDGMVTANAYSRLICASDRLSGVVPQIAVVAGVCAASSAIWAQCSDVIIMADNAEMFVTSPYLLGDKVGSADTAKSNGTAHIVCDKDSAVSKAREVLSYLPSNNISSAAEADCAPAVGSFETDDASKAILAIADEGSVLELRPEFGNTSAVAFARIAGASVGVNSVYGEISADDCAKLASFIGVCDAFSIPIVTLINTEGFASAESDELNGISKSAALLTKAYANATTAKVALVTGKAYGAAFTALAGKSSGADVVLSFNDAVISAIKPEAAATVLYNDQILCGADKKGVLNDYINNFASAEAVAKSGVIDDVIDVNDAAAKVLGALDMLASKRVTTLDKKHVVLSL